MSATVTNVATRRQHWNSDYSAACIECWQHLHSPQRNLPGMDSQWELLLWPESHQEPAWENLVSPVSTKEQKSCYVCHDLIQHTAMTTHTPHLSSLAVIYTHIHIFIQLYVMVRNHKSEGTITHCSFSLYLTHTHVWCKSLQTHCIMWRETHIVTHRLWNGSLHVFLPAQLHTWWPEGTIG